MTLHGRDSDVETPTFERVVGSLGASIDICTEDNGDADSFDAEDEDWVENGGNLPTQVEDLETTGGEDGSDSGVDSDLEGEGTSARLEMTTPELPE